METYTLSNLRDDISRILPPGEYDIDAITNALHADHGLTHPDGIPEDTFWSTVADHAIEDNDQAQQFRAELSAALADKTMNRIAHWTNGHVTIDISGGSRVNHNFPMPLSTITITPAGEDPETHSGETIPSWDALWTLVADATERVTESGEEAAISAHCAQMTINRLERELHAAKVRRNEQLKAAHARNISKYALAKKLGVYESTIGRIVNS